MKHSELGGSSAYRWLNCPGSVRLARGMPELSSKYAQEGRDAHEYAAGLLGYFLDGKSHPFALNLKLEDDEMEAVEDYAKYALDKFREMQDKDPGAIFGIEEKVELNMVHVGMFGYVDFYCYSPLAKKLLVIDYKHGVGEFVSEKSNAQLKYYAIGVLESKALKGKKVSVVETAIVQPRCFMGDSIRTAEHSISDIVEFMAELAEGAERTAKITPKLKAGDWCRYCPAAVKCDVLTNQVTSITQGEAIDFTADRPIPFLTTGQMLKAIPIIKSWIKNVEAMAEKEVAEGKAPEGFKIVPKRAMRKWKEDPAITKRKLLAMGAKEEEILSPRNLKSVAQVEKTLKDGKKEELEELYVRVSSGNTWAPLDDRRKEAKITTGAERFADISLPNLGDRNE